MATYNIILYITSFLQQPTAPQGAPDLPTCYSKTPYLVTATKKNIVDPKKDERNLFEISSTVT